MQQSVCGHQAQQRWRRAPPPAAAAAGAAHAARRKAAAAQQVFAFEPGSFTHTPRYLHTWAAVCLLQQPGSCTGLAQRLCVPHQVVAGWSQHTTAYPTGSSSGSSGSNQTIAQAASAQTNQASGSQTMKRPSGKLQHVFSKGQVLGDGRCVQFCLLPGCLALPALC